MSKESANHSELPRMIKPMLITVKWLGPRLGERQRQDFLAELTKAPKPQEPVDCPYDIRDIFNASNRRHAEDRLKFYVAKYEKTTPQLSKWMEENLPEGLTVFALAVEHRRRIWTTNMLERVHEEINRRTRVAGLFPHEASLLRLVSVILMELSEEWETGKRYLDMAVDNDDSASEQQKIYRKKVRDLFIS